ncbi:NUDIX hydrolase [Cellulomonas xiejunii]|uniref:NUDIX hydrolase n=1 Tax=Cellulomonas xiejunii TaxID=2968083 RepID=UPI001D0E52BC|nr:DUF4743 domain-containing protein [Cellulomonas xiejunii]MCC2314012.1 DUF4743 domain-containing protein [Cellulomonas xiejunii]
MAAGPVDWPTVCNTRDLGRYTPFVGAGTHLGWVPHDLLPQLRGRAGFSVSNDAVVLSPTLTSVADRSDVLAHLAQEWRDEGLVPGWRDESYDVVPYAGGPVVCRMERAVTRLFGCINRGVHLNGYTRDDGQLRMWVARRSAQKATFPGLLDQMVAGGVGSGLSLDSVIRREAQEEAGIPAGMTADLRVASVVTMFMEHQGRIFRDVEYVYDLELPSDFVPSNADAEVSEFMQLPMAEVLRLVAQTTQFKPDCNLVILDFGIRHDLIRPGDPTYRPAVTKLREGVS